LEKPERHFPKAENLLFLSYLFQLNLLVIPLFRRFNINSV